MTGEFTLDTVCYNDSTGQDALFSTGTPISEINEDDGGFYFIDCNGDYHECDEPLSLCVKIDGVKYEAVEQVAKAPYKPCPNMTPLSRKFLLL